MDIELDELHVPFLDTPPPTGVDFEKLARGSVRDSYVVDFHGHPVAVQSADWRDSTLLRLQIAAGFLDFVLFGLAEQTLGTTIPRLQAHYQVDDLLTGVVFLAATLGYFTMALATDVLHRTLGVRGVGLLGTLSMTLAYMTISFRPPFAVFVACYFLSGVGFGSLDASLNGWMGGLVDLNQLLGILHGCYGIGCMISPPLITRLLERKANPWHWNDYYLVLSCCAALCLVFSALVFRQETAAKYAFSTLLKEARRKAADGANDAEDTDDAAKDAASEDSAPLRDALRLRLVWFFAAIMFVYVGGEVAFGAWLVTFLTRIKRLPYKLSSYMATLFWLGLTAGRICLGFVTAHYFANELSANWVYIALSLAFNVLFCLFAFTNATALLFVIVFFAGLVVGPIFPTTIVASISVLPVKYHATGVGFICAFGGGGGAAVPFLIGLIAETSTLGLKFYPFIITAMYVLLLAAWLVLKVRNSNHKRAPAL